MRVVMRRKCFSLLKERATSLRPRQKVFEKQGFHFGLDSAGMFGTAPWASIRSRMALPS